MIDPGLAGRVALVTGGNSGIGAAVVRELAAQGAAVAIGNYLVEVPVRLIRWVAFTGSVVLAASCGDTVDGGGMQTAAARADLVLRWSITLEEAPEDPIIDVRRLAVFGDRFVAFADRRASRVRVHDLEGRRVAALGRFGSGPEEFRGPLDVVFDGDGRLYVSDAGNGRIARYDANFVFDTVFPSPPLLPMWLHIENSSLLVAVAGRLWHARHRVERLSTEGERLATYGTPDSLASEVPYWGSALKIELAVLPDGLLLASSLLYPMWRLRWDDGDSEPFGGPPPSFVAARRPQPGEFAGARQALVGDWLQSFTTIDRVGVYRDSLVVAVHGRVAPAPGEPYRLVHTFMDVYDVNGNKLAEDAAVPERILAVGNYVYVLAAEPPDPWQVGVYELVLR